MGAVKDCRLRLFRRRLRICRLDRRFLATARIDRQLAIGEDLGGLSYLTRTQSIRIRTEPATVVQPKKSEIRHSVQRRLEFIEFRLFWEGQINRSDIVEQFGVSVPQASGDLKRYQESAPDFIRYDSHLKTYRPTERFRPLYLRPSADAYLSQLRLKESGFVAEDDTWAEEMPDFSVVPILRRPVKPEILRAVINSARDSHALKIKYLSAYSDATTWRWIAPHAFGYDGFGWHARSWCLRNQGFRDFVLTRILEVDGSRPEKLNRAEDVEWNHSVTLILEPNPKLEPGHRRAVELDYRMEDGKCRIETRVSLLYYMMGHLCLGLEYETVDPMIARLVLVNRDEVERIRDAVKHQSRAEAHE